MKHFAAEHGVSSFSSHGGLRQSIAFDVWGMSKANLLLLWSARGNMLRYCCTLPGEQIQSGIRIKVAHDYGGYPSVLAVWRSHGTEGTLATLRFCWQRLVGELHGGRAVPRVLSRPFVLVHNHWVDRIAFTVARPRKVPPDRCQAKPFSR